MRGDQYLVTNRCDGRFGHSGPRLLDVVASTSWSDARCGVSPGRGLGSHILLSTKKAAAYNLSFNIMLIMRMPSMFVAVALDSSSWHVQ